MQHIKSSCARSEHGELRIEGIVVGTIIYWLKHVVKRYSPRFELCLLVGLFLTTEGGATSRKEEKIDYVVAVVNEQAITWTELQSALVIPTFVDPMLSLSPQMLNQLENPSLEVQRTVLEILIDRTLMLQEAERWGIPLARWHEKVATDMSKLMAAYPSEETFFKILKASRLEYEELEEWLRSGLIIDELILRRFINRIDGEEMEKQATKHFQQHKSDYSLPAQARFQYVLVSSKPNAPVSRQTEAKQLAQYIYLRLREGTAVQSIPEIAANPVKIIASTKTENIHTEIGQLIVELEANRWNRPIQTPDGYLVTRLLSLEKPRLRKYTEVRQKIKRRLVEKQVAEQMEIWLEEQKKTGDWRILNPALSELQQNDRSTKP